MGKRRRIRRPRQEPQQAALGTVWATGQRDPITDLVERGYHIDSARDHHSVPPDVAEHAVRAYCPPSGTVLDPDCGAGVVIAEAVRSGRHAVGLAATRHWQILARANVNSVRLTDPTRDAMVLVLGRSADTLRTAQLAGLSGRIDLLLTALRPPAGTTTPDGATARLRTMLANARALLRPGGHVVVTAQPSRQGAEPAHRIGDVLATGHAAGLLPIQRCVALTGPIRKDTIASRATRSERRDAAQQARAWGHPVALPAHLDILVFRCPPADLAAADALRPHPGAAPADPLVRAA